MMATVNDVLRVARGQIGYRAANDPQPGSKYGRWMASKTGEQWLAGPSTSVWWCMIFVSWVFDQCRQACPGLPSYNTDLTLSRARAAGRVVGKYSARPGDIVIFQWGGGGTDHVGIVEQNNGGHLTCIEGNTSPGSAGSQSAGGGVWRRTRPFSVVAGVIRPPYGTKTTPKKTPQEFIQEVISEMRATHIIFQYGKALGISNVLAGTYELFTNSADYRDRCYVIKQAGGKLVTWGALRKKKGSDANRVGNLEAMGKRL